MSTIDAKKLGRQHSSEFWAARDAGAPDPHHINPYERNSLEWNAYCSGWHTFTSERPGWPGNDEYALVKNMPKQGDSMTTSVAFELECEPSVEGITDMLARLAHEVFGTSGCKVKSILLTTSQWSMISDPSISGKRPIGTPGSLVWDSDVERIYMLGPTGQRVQLKVRPQ